MVVLRRILYNVVVPSHAVRWGTLTATWRGPPDGAVEVLRGRLEAADVEAWHAASQPYRGFL